MTNLLYTAPVPEQHFVFLQLFSITPDKLHHRQKDACSRCVSIRQYRLLDRLLVMVYIHVSKLTSARNFTNKTLVYKHCKRCAFKVKYDDGVSSTFCHVYLTPQISKLISVLSVSCFYSRKCWYSYFH